MFVYIGNMSNLHPAHRTEDGRHLRPHGRRFNFAHANKFNLITFIVMFVGIRYVSCASRTLFPSSIAGEPSTLACGIPESLTMSIVFTSIGISLPLSDLMVLSK
jgi:hypothetical protein